MMIRINICTLVIVFSSILLKSQNVGIGLNNPVYKLDVAGTFRLQNTTNTAGLWFDGTTLPTRSFIGTYTNDLFGIYGSAAGWHFLINHNNNNIGIGTIPDYRLDILGRVRIQKSSAYGAGIWFDGTTTAMRSFIGTQAGNNFGMWGSGGAGWGLAMDVANGNIGIGTTFPSKKLDLNGSLRLRSDAPVKGSIIVSKDSNGNTEWANPIAFRGASTVNNEDLLVPNGVWTKVIFHQGPSYNLGNDYLPNSADFIAPVDGIYELHTTSLIGYLNDDSKVQGVRFVLERGANISIIGESIDYGLSTVSYDGYFRSTNPLSVDAKLLTGDKVWVEVYAVPEANEPSNVLLGQETTCFTGNLIARI